MKSIFALAAALLTPGMALAQTASLAVTTTTSNVSLPAETSAGPFVTLSTPTGAPKVYYTIGIDGAEAVRTGPSIPSGGGSVCQPIMPSIRKARVAALADQGTTTLSIAQQASCPQKSQ